MPDQTKNTFKGHSWIWCWTCWMMQQRLKRPTPALLLENTLTVLGRTTLGQTGTACRSSTFQQTESNRPKQSDAAERCRCVSICGRRRPFSRMSFFSVGRFSLFITYSTGINQNVPKRTGCVATTSRCKMWQYTNHSADVWVVGVKFNSSAVWRNTGIRLTHLHLLISGEAPTKTHLTAANKKCSANNKKNCLKLLDDTRYESVLHWGSKQPWYGHILTML